MAPGEAQQEAEASLVATVVAALDGDDAGACLDAALALLRAQGLAEPDGVDGSWLELRRGELALRLVAAAGVAPPGPRAHGLLAHALGAALARVSEGHEARKVRERTELLSSASFEGILIHDGGVAVDCNERLCEMIGYSRD